MTKTPPSLFQTLMLPLLLAGGLAIAAGIATSVWIFRAEYDELLDQSTKTKAELLLPLAADRWNRRGGETSDPFAGLPAASGAVYWLIDGEGAVVARSGDAPAQVVPVYPDGFATAGDYRHFATGVDESGLRMEIAEPLMERDEAVFEALVAAIAGMVVPVLLGFWLMRRAVRRVHKRVVDLSAAIGARDETNLSPIDAGSSFIELAPAIETVNHLMTRLEAAVEVERRFATNAAHELRTPLAESLAHTQRLRSMGSDPGVLDRAVQIETGLKKLIHLVERLLQFSRAQSGLGRLDTAADANQVIRLLFQEAQDRHTGKARIETHMPQGTFMSSIDPDALAIILSNLIDNAVKHGAVKHGAATTPIVLDARHPGQVAISNDCGTLSAEDLAKIKSRFTRRTKGVKGYGIGLSIVEMLCAQSGARLDLASPLPQAKSGFRAVLRLP